MLCRCTAHATCIVAKLTSIHAMHLKDASHGQIVGHKIVLVWLWALQRATQAAVKAMQYSRKSLCKSPVKTC